MDLKWLAEQLDRPGYTQAGLARALTRILDGDEDGDLAAGLDDIDTAILNRTAGAVAGRISLPEQLWPAMALGPLLGAIPGLLDVLGYLHRTRSTAMSRPPGRARCRPASEACTRGTVAAPVCSLSAGSHGFLLRYACRWPATRDPRGNFHDHVGAKMGAIVRSLPDFSRPLQA